jgi:hypothetical protein
VESATVNFFVALGLVFLSLGGQRLRIPDHIVVLLGNGVLAGSVGLTGELLDQIGGVIGAAFIA